MVFDNTTGKQRIHITHKSGANWYMNDKVVSTFSPNDLQELARGNVYKTATGDTFIQSQKNTEHRTFGDFRIITGSPNFFDKGFVHPPCIPCKIDDAACKLEDSLTFCNAFNLRNERRCLN